MLKTIMTFSNMDRLPEELVDRIFYFVDHRASLHALCLVSRDLNRIATSHLYTAIALDRDDFQHLRPLALLLWTSPKHRAIVRSISVRRAYGGNLVPWPRHPCLDELIQQQVKLYVREGDTMPWFAKVKDGIDALPIASLLLRSLPNVTTMEFDGFNLIDPKVRETAIR
jgi:hypothetical protein